MCTNNIIKKQRQWICATELKEVAKEWRPTHMGLDSRPAKFSNWHFKTNDANTDRWQSPKRMLVTQNIRKRGPYLIICKAKCQILASEMIKGVI